MRFLIFLFLALQTSISFSQPPGGGGGGRPPGGGNQQGQKPPRDENNESKSFEETNIKEFAGLQSFDSEVVIKAIKIKTEEEKENLKSLFMVYNSRIKEIEKEHLLLIETTELETRIKEKKAIENKNMKEMMEAKRSASISLEVVFNKTIEAKKTLNKELEASLTEKYFKKWIKYFEKNNKNKPPLLENEPDSDNDFKRSPPKR
jgi:hypothetical protein